MTAHWLASPLACLALLLSALATADESRPLYIELSELQAANHSTSSYKVQWRVPGSVPAYNSPQVTLPENCQALAPPADQAAGGGLISQALYQCERPLSGQVLTLSYPGYNPSISSLIKYRTLKGEQHTQLLGPEQLQWQVPEAETAAGVAWDYTVLGVEHIWAGTDHLLFVVCLLWIAGSLRRILVTITGFTLAHSVTLALSALKVVQLPVPPVEAVIALSIVFLASEIAKGRRNNLTWRYPIAVSSSFGLLHGFGFAAALAEVGLPQTELLTGLLFFNVGVEIGQVVFAIAAIALVLASERLLSHGRLFGDWQGSTFAHRSQVAVSYAVGGVASYWLVERCVGFLV